MFTVDFGGTIGMRDVKVCNSLPCDDSRTVGVTQRALDFGNPSHASPSCAPGSTHNVANVVLVGAVVLHPLHPLAALLSDSDLDVDWMANFVDFADADGGECMPLPSSLLLNWT